MTSSRPHVIRRQTLEVDVVGTESDGLALQRTLPGLLRASLLPALETVLDRVAPVDEHWTIDRLEIDAGSWEVGALERGLVDAVTQGVGRFFDEHAPPLGSNRQPAQGERSGRSVGAGEPSDAIERRSRAQSLQVVFLHFLRTGTLPWWFSPQQGSTLEDLIRETWHAGAPDGQPSHFAAVLPGVIGLPAVRARLVRQFSADFLETLLGTLAPASVVEVQYALDRIANAGLAADAIERAAEQVWQTAFLMTTSGERLTAETLLAATRRNLRTDTEGNREPPVQIPERRDGGAVEPSRHAGVPAIREPIPRSPSPRRAHDEAAPRIDLDDGVHVICAGIVLLHPFLPRLFEAVGIAEDGRLLQAERAMCLMHFLATGQRVAPEYDLLLPKLLCNVPPDTPVARIVLTTAEEEEAEALLAAVIGHWDALGETSADGLRGTFLVRPGKLSRKWDQDVLQVDTQSFDILLDRLPWGIGLIQLPWMEQRLWVEWRL